MLTQPVILTIKNQKVAICPSTLVLQVPYGTPIATESNSYCNGLAFCRDCYLNNGPCEESATELYDQYMKIFENPKTSKHISAHEPVVQKTPKRTHSDNTCQP